MSHKGRRGLGRCLGSTTRVQWEHWWSLTSQTAPLWRLQQNGRRTWTETAVSTADTCSLPSCWPTNVTVKEETEETHPGWTASVRRTASAAGLRLQLRCVYNDADLHPPPPVFYSNIKIYRYFKYVFSCSFHIQRKVTYLSYDPELAFYCSCTRLLIKSVQILTWRNHLPPGFWAQPSRTQSFKSHILPVCRTTSILMRQSTSSSNKWCSSTVACPVKRSSGTESRWGGRQRMVCAGRCAAEDQGCRAESQKQLS